MRISIITLFPDMLTGFFNSSIVKRAQEKKAVNIDLIQLRDFAIDTYGTVDDHVYGGGAGMLLRVDVVHKALTSIKDANTAVATKTILTSAQGNVYTQKKAFEYSNLDHLIVIAGHYEGVDARTSSLIDEEVSIGDFVLTGGELPAAVLVDSVIRLLPGVLHKQKATEEETFREVQIVDLKKAGIDEPLLTTLEEKGKKSITLLEYPQYTRPQEYNKISVPEILLSGDHKKIITWRLQQAWKMTKKRRKDLLL